MSAAAPSWTVPMPAPGVNRLLMRVLSLLLGVGFTLALFLGVAHIQKTAPKRLPTELDELRIAVVPAEPPPPPVVKEKIPEPEVAPMVGFKLAPSDSDVKIIVSPPEASALLPEDLSKAPPANAHVDFWASYAPRMDVLSDPDHVFDKSEVDKVPTVLARTDPQVPRTVAGEAVYLSCTLLAIINADGAISTIRLATSSGNPRFDALIIDNFREWTFSPAIKSGKKVRCLIEQAIRVKCSPESPFES
jgi:TonB family protein